ncbi:MAG: hypothetical protein J2P18_07535 [Nocardia sp.]|nr:hypothetical protein [Nocardia sp.]
MMPRFSLLLMVAVVGLYAVVTSPDVVIGLVIAAAVFVVGVRWLAGSMVRGRRGWRR